jgi:16S rRNA (cytidine1402-2'-O)-methyltransferase
MSERSELTMTGRLVLVATPIGNLGDLAPRAVEALRTAGAIVCEDTRRTGRLLQHAGISGARLLVANEHTEAACAQEVAALLARGTTVAVVTDAGTPGISDPGERLVRAAVAGGHAVEAVPGPSAALHALVVSGLPAARFVVEGFLPRRGPERRARLAEVGTETRTIVLFEAPHRLGRTLADLQEVCGPDRAVVVARELTKLHEEVWRGSIAEAVARAAAREPRGEHVVVVAGAPPVTAGIADVEAALAACLAAGMDRRAAVAEVARDLGVAKRTVYDAALRLRDQTASS